MLGPLENADLVGLDLTRDIHRTIIPELNRDDRPNPLLETKIAAGKLGFKSGEGFRTVERGGCRQLRARLRRHLRQAAQGPRHDPGGDTSGMSSKVVVLMALGFGLVGIDRFLISPMFPTIAQELHLDYGDIGTIAGALALAWGVAALLMGNLSDRIGRRKVLIGALMRFRLLIGASGLAAGLMGLVLVRIMMGFADGAYTPPSISATLEASPLARHGLNIGIQQMMLPLVRAGAGAAGSSAQLLPHHRLALDFSMLFSMPGLLLALAEYGTLRRAHGGRIAEARNSFADWQRRARLIATSAC